MEKISPLLILLFVFITLVESSSNITLLTSENFQHLINDDNIWAVNFYSSKDNKNKNFEKEFARSADILKGLVKFGAVDVEDNKEVVDNFTINVKVLPAVKFYGISSDGSARDYKGSNTAYDIVQSVMDNILEKIKKRIGKRQEKSIIEEVSDKNFDDIITKTKEPWMLLFYAPWCVHCKEIKPIWKQVASRVKNKIKCASMDATINTIKAKEYQITQYPTIKLLPFQNKSLKHSFDYSQKRDVDSIVDWALKLLPGPEVVQLTSGEVFQEHCVEQNLCIISALPSIFDCQADCRNNYLDILRKLSEKLKMLKWGWTWTEAGVQKDLERILDIGGFGYPTLVVLNPAKMKYSVFKGSFIKNEIYGFLNKLATIKAAGIDEDMVGKIVTVEPWDGKDSTNELPRELYLHDAELGNKEEL